MTVCIHDNGVEFLWVGQLLGRVWASPTLVHSMLSLSLWYVRTSVRMSWPAWPAQLVTRTAYCYCHHVCLLSCPHFAFHLFCQASTYVQLVSHSPAVRPHLIHADRRQREKEIGWPLVVFFGMYCRKATQHLVPIIVSIETYCSTQKNGIHVINKWPNLEQGIIHFFRSLFCWLQSTKLGWKSCHIVQPISLSPRNVLYFNYLHPLLCTMSELSPPHLTELK